MSIDAHKALTTFLIFSPGGGRRNRDWSVNRVYLRSLFSERSELTFLLEHFTKFSEVKTGFHDPFDFLKADLLYHQVMNYIFFHESVYGFAYLVS